jgi:hypothetical protein
MHLAAQLAAGERLDPIVAGELQGAKDDISSMQ